MTPRVNRPAYVLLFSLGISAVFTGAIATVQVLSQPTLRRNEELMRYRGIVEVFGLGDVKAMTRQEVLDVVRARTSLDQPPPPPLPAAITDPRTGWTFPLTYAFQAHAPHTRQHVSAVAFPFSGVGFWARIRGLLAVNADASQIVGIAFLEQAETPGLGGRITEESFRRQFEGLRADAPEGGGPFLYVGGMAPEPGDRRHGRHVDAITGATQTSTAVGEMLHETLARFRRAYDADGSLGGAATTRPGRDGPP